MDDGSDSPGQGSGFEGKINLQEMRIGQTVATAITYSYIQNQSHPQNNKLIPTFNVSSDGFYAIFYDLVLEDISLSGYSAIRDYINF